MDAHVHVWDPVRHRHGWLDDDDESRLRRVFDLSDYRRASAGGMAGLPVGGVVLVQALDIMAESADLLATAAQDELVAGVVGWVDLTNPAVNDQITRLVTSPGGDKLRGIRHLVHDETDPDWLARPDVRRGLSAVADAGLTFDLLLRPHHLTVALDAATRLPNLTFVLDHAGKPDLGRAGVGGEDWSTWSADLRRLAARPNVTAKLSGLTTLTDGPAWEVADLSAAVDVLLESFGPQRLMFGSDWPVCLLTADWDRWAAAAAALLDSLTLDERTDLFCDSAGRVYGFPAAIPVSANFDKELQC